MLLVFEILIGSPWVAKLSARIQFRFLTQYEQMQDTTAIDHRAVAELRLGVGAAPFGF
jgi:hypothetical protein